MTQVERIRAMCKEKGVAVKKLESDLGYGNGFLNPKKIKVVASDRLFTISEYLGVSPAYLATGEEEAPAPGGGDERTEWISAWEQATPEARAAALSVLRLGAQQPEAPGKRQP